jgi:DNA-binding CsgD family transcriptional regulator
MLMAADLGGLVELAYSAAVDDALWRNWTEELIEQLGGRGALFYLIDPARFEMCRNYMCFRDRDNEDLEREYHSGPIADDPQMHRVCGVKRSEIYLDVDHVDVEDPRTREYLAWQEARCGTRHHITASVVLPDGFEAGVSVHFAASQGIATEAVQRQMRALFPHFARALRLGFRHAEGVQQSWWDGLSGDQSKALVLLDDAGRVLRSTPAAESIFRRNDGLTITAGQLQCADPANEQGLKHVIGRACARWNAAASGACIRRAHERRPYSVSAYPLTQRRRFLAPHGAAALVIIDDPSAELRGLAAHHKQMLGFTSREGQVADLLLAGHSLESLATSLGITRDTARSHLKSLFHKTGTSRQTELLSFLARLR